jgi:hypothetical protein
MSVPANVKFSVIDAYDFAKSHGLHSEVDDICDKVRGPLKNKLNVTSVRKGYMVDLLQRHKIFDEFKAKFWPLDNRQDLEKERKRVLGAKEKHERG